MTENVRKIDEKEESRVDNIYDELIAGKKIYPNELFGNETVPKMLEETPLSYFNSFSGIYGKLPMNSLLYSKIIVYVCPNCPCVNNPLLIKPYLERSLVLPILSHPLADYKPEFVNLLVQFPYVSNDVRNIIKIVTADKMATCPRCYEKKWKPLFSKIKKANVNKKRKQYLEGLLKDCVEPLFSYATTEQLTVFDELKDAINHEEFDRLDSLTLKGEVLETFRYASGFDAIPQVDQHDLSNISQISQELRLPVNLNLERIEEKELALSALNLTYNPKMPVEEYLDIILPRRKKINALVDQMLNAENQDKQIAQINDEVWKINNEVTSSKSLESISFLTRLVTDNVGIISSMLVGALIGYSSAEALGCGIGGATGILGNIAGKKISKHTGLKLPKYPRKTIEWIKTKVESPEEKLLSLVLSKDIHAIQVWSLRKKIKRE